MESEECTFADNDEDDFSTPQHLPDFYSHTPIAIKSSQDSIDVFHDASSNLNNSLLRIAPLPKTSQESSGDDAIRKRHFSSGARFESPNCDDDVTETTYMLSPEGGGSRRRHASSGKPRIPAASPFRFISNSTHSLKPTNLNRSLVHNINCSNNTADKNLLASNSNLCSMSSPIPINYVPCSEVVLRRTGTQTSDKVEENNSKNLLPPSNLSTTPKHQYDPATVNSSAWMRNYVACVEGDNFFSHNRLTDDEKPVETSNHQLRASLLNPKVEKNLEYKLGIYEKHEVYKKQATCCQKFRKAFRLANCRFEHESPHLFVTSQWQSPDQLNCLYLGYRLFWAIYFLMWAIWSLVGFNSYSNDWSTKPYYFLYLTNWTIWLLAVDTSLQVANVIRHMKKISGKGSGRYQRMKRSFKVSWVLSTLMCTMEIFTAFLYWALIYPRKMDVEIVNEINVNTHIVPALYVVMDLFVAATPRRLLHVYLPMIYLTIYGAFTDVYYLCGGLDLHNTTDLYPILDWRVPFSTLMMGAGLILIIVPIVHTTVCCLAFIRKWISRKGKTRPIELDSYRMTEQYANDAPV